MKTPSTKSASPLFSRYALDAHHRFLAGCAISALTFLGLHGRVTLPTQLVVVWDMFTLTILALAWVVISTKDPYEARRNARLQDSSATFLFVFVISAATASLVAVGLLLLSAKNLSPTALARHIALSVTAVVLSWMLLRLRLFFLRRRDDVPGLRRAGFLVANAPRHPRARLDFICLQHRDPRDVRQHHRRADLTRGLNFYL